MKREEFNALPFHFVLLLVHVEGEFHLVGLVGLHDLSSHGEDIIVHLLVGSYIEDGLSILHELVTHLLIIPFIIDVALADI